MSARALLFLRTLRHLGARQIVARASRLAERLLWRVTGAQVSRLRAPALRAHVPLWGDLSDDREAVRRAREVLAGRFTFLGETRVCRHWATGDASHLWRFHLHYFDYARDLAVLAAHDVRDRAYEGFRNLAGSWIDAHRRLGGDAWHPYTVSLRIVNWCEAAVVFRGELERDTAFARTFHDSLATQTEFLSRHIEDDVRGNHIIENARALVRASFFFEGDEPQRWLRRGMAILRREIPEQVLNDGGHFERAPGYHLRVMKVLDDVATLLRSNGEGASELDDAVRRMADFLAAILPANGRLPLFKDTVLAPAPLPGGHAQPSRWLASSGYTVIRDDDRGDHLIADFGRVCPDYLPAHAHADMFSFELTIGGNPVVVDSGVFEYAEGGWRNWFRSTPAHNTVAIDGRDQSEMWSSFRVGRRARVKDVVWRSSPELTSIEGRHHGYAPVIHRRVIAVLPEPRLWIVIDRLSGAAGRVATSYLHLHPDRPHLAVVPLGEVSVSHGEGWYSERFGEKRANRVILFCATTPAWIGYAIAADEAPVAEMAPRGEGVCIQIRTSSWTGTIAVDERGARIG